MSVLDRAIVATFCKETRIDIAGRHMLDFVVATHALISSDELTALLPSGRGRGGHSNIKGIARANLRYNIGFELGRRRGGSDDSVKRCLKPVTAQGTHGLSIIDAVLNVAGDANEVISILRTSGLFSDELLAQLPGAVVPLDVGILPLLDDFISHARSLESGASPPDGDPVEKMPRLDDLLKLKASLAAASKEKAMATPEKAEKEATEAAPANVGSGASSLGSDVDPALKKMYALQKSAVKELEQVKSTVKEVKA